MHHARARARACVCVRVCLCEVGGGLLALGAHHHVTVCFTQPLQWQW